jgi:hypothetical protein
MSEDKAPNLRKVPSCLTCDHSIKTGFDMGSQIDYCDLHKFHFTDQPWSILCDDWKAPIITNYNYKIERKNENEV